MPIILSSCEVILIGMASWRDLDQIMQNQIVTTQSGHSPLSQQPAYVSTTWLNLQPDTA